MGRTPGRSHLTFMKRIARGDRVIVVLSDKYLRSPFCMYELYEIWLQARGEDERFLKRIRVYTEADAKIWTILDRLQCATYWDEQYAQHAAIEGNKLLLLAEKDLERIKLMRRFASHVGDILNVVTDILQPSDLDKLVSYSFDGGEFDD
jgi:internalin A